jgi:hypothetical protein
MKRLLALVLVGGALLLGGCDRERAPTPAVPDRPAATKSTPTTKDAPAPTSAATKDASANAPDHSDVDSLLRNVDKQLSSDDQPPADQD